MPVHGRKICLKTQGRIQPNLCDILSVQRKNVVVPTHSQKGTQKCSTSVVNISYIYEPMNYFLHNYLLKINMYMYMSLMSHIALKEIHICRFLGRVFWQFGGELISFFKVPWQIVWRGFPAATPHFGPLWMAVLLPTQLIGQQITKILHCSICLHFLENCKF